MRFLNLFLLAVGSVLATSAFSQDNAVLTAQVFHVPRHFDGRNVYGRPNFGRPDPRQQQNFGQQPALAAPMRQADAEQYFKQAIEKAAQYSNKIACIASQARILEGDAALKAGLARHGRLGGHLYFADARVFQALATGAICMRETETAARQAVVKTLMAASEANDFYSAGPSLRPLQAELSAVSDKYSVLNNAYDAAIFNPKPEHANAAALLKGIFGNDESNQRALNLASSAFFTRGDGVEVYFRKLVDYIDSTSDVETIRRLGQAHVAFFNAYYYSNGLSFDPADQNGRGRDEIFDGNDPVAKAKAAPDAPNIMNLLVAKADPVSSNYLKNGRSKPVDPNAPTAGHLAILFGDSFYRGHEKHKELTQIGMLTQRIVPPYGYAVTWGIPQSIGADLPTYSETLTFLVNDMPGPSCQKRGNGYRCDLQLHIANEEVSIQGELGRAVIGLLGNTPVPLAEQRADEFKTKIKRRDFEWTAMTIDIVRDGGIWRSKLLDTEMRTLASRMDTTRERKGRAMNESASQPSATDQSCSALRAGAMANSSSGISDNLWFQMAC